MPRLCVCLLSIALLLAGCEPGPTPSKPNETSATPAPVPYQDLTQGAPQDPVAFAEWADTAVRQTPDPQPAPPVHRSGSSWRVLDLVDRFDPENIVSPFAGGEPDNQPIVELGPFSSDRERARFKVQKLKNRRGKRIWNMSVKFLPPVRCEDVGRIRLHVRVPHGNYLELRWKDVGKLRIPVADNEQVLPLSISTDGFSSWEGNLSELVLRSDRSPDPVEIETIALYRPSASYNKAAAVARVRLADEMQTAIYAHAPGSVRLEEIAVPPNGRLSLSTGFLAEEATAQVGFEVVVQRGRDKSTLLQHRGKLGNRWTRHGIDLSSYAGQVTSVELHTPDAPPGTVAFWGNPQVYEPHENPPLVILYLIDTLSAHHIDLYGYERETMPFLKQMAEEGAWFENMYANSPVTVSSVKDMLLSMPAMQHGVYSYSVTAPRELVPIPEAIRDRGVATMLMSTNVNAGPAQQTDRGFDTFIDRIAYTWSKGANRTVPIPQVMRWLEAHRDRPVLLYVHTAEPHAPYEAPLDFRRMYTDQGVGVDKVDDYDAEVRFADDRLQAFCQALKDAGLYDRAHILVTADHGEELGEHGHFGHGQGLFNEVMRIPLVMRGPSIPQRGRVQRPAQLFDIAPTLLRLFEIAAPYPLSGIDLLPLARDPQQGNDLKRTIVGGFDELRGQDLREWFIVRDGTWKLIFWRKRGPISEPRPARFRLFNLQEDPEEQRNVLAEHPQVFRELVLDILRFAGSHPPYITRQEQGSLEFDLQQIEQLRALGYVD